MGNDEFSIEVQKENEQGKKEKIKITNNQTIFCVKYLISEIYHIDIDNFLLYYKDNFLNESQLVSFYNINKGDILTIREGFKINIEAKIGKAEKIKNYSITIVENMTIKEIKEMINLKKFYISYNYINIYFNDELLDETKKVSDYNITSKDKLSVIIKSSNPDEFLIFFSGEDEKKYGLFVKNEYKVKYIIDLFCYKYNIRNEDYFYFKKNRLLMEDRTIEEESIKEFNVLVRVKPVMYG